MSKLFIYIPTYNRPDALRQQLSVILPQVINESDGVRILVNDNASSKPLLDIYEKYSEFKNIEFRTNCGNIGGNANIALGFVFAKADEFLWILSDNDIVSDNAISYLLSHLDSKIDFYCFNDTVDSPKELDYNWSDGWMTPMEWRMGLISDALYNVNTIKDFIDAAFFYHNSSFPHLAVACATAKNKGTVKFKILPGNKINKSLHSSFEYPTDYSLAHVCMPLLIPLFPTNEAKEFSFKWLKGNGVNLYKNRKRHYNLYLQSRATLAYYGGLRTKFLLVLMGPLYMFISPLINLRQATINKAKNHCSPDTLNRLKKLRSIMWGK